MAEVLIIGGSDAGISAAFCPREVTVPLRSGRALKTVDAELGKVALG